MLLQTSRFKSLRWHCSYFLILVLKSELNYEQKVGASLYISPPFCVCLNQNQWEALACPNNWTPSVFPKSFTLNYTSSYSHKPPHDSVSFPCKCDTRQGRALITRWHLRRRRRRSCFFKSIGPAHSLRGHSPESQYNTLPSWNHAERDTMQTALASAIFAKSLHLYHEKNSEDSSPSLA